MVIRFWIITMFLVVLGPVNPEATLKGNRHLFLCAQSRATVVGLGATGLSLARFLSRRRARS